MEVKSIRNRRHSVLVRLNDQELAHLHRLVQQSGLPQEKLLRKVITGYQVKATPPLEYHEIIKQLLMIGNNLNQIAVLAHATRQFDSVKYADNYRSLICQLLHIQDQIEV